MKTMHSEIKDRRISIFVISKRSDQITAIKWAEYTEINQDRPVWGGEENMLLAAYTNVWQKKLTSMCLDLLFQLLSRGNLVPQGKCLCQWNLRAAPWEFERWYVLPWPLLQSLTDKFVNHFLEIIEILWTLCNTRFIKGHKPSNHIRARIKSHVYTTEWTVYHSTYHVKRHNKASYEYYLLHEWQNVWYSGSVNTYTKTLRS